MQQGDRSAPATRHVAIYSRAHGDPQGEGSDVKGGVRDDSVRRRA